MITKINSIATTTDFYREVYASETNIKNLNINLENDKFKDTLLFPQSETKKIVNN